MSPTTGGLSSNPSITLNVASSESLSMSSVWSVAVNVTVSLPIQPSSYVTITTFSSSISTIIPRVCIASGSGVTFNFTVVNAGLSNVKEVSDNISTVNIAPPNASCNIQELIRSPQPVLSQETVIKLSVSYASKISYSCSE